MIINNKISAYIKSMRPETWFLGSMPIFFMGLIASGFELSLQTLYGIFSLIMIIVVMLLGGTNMFNEVFDTEADKINKPKRPIVSGAITRKSAFVISTLLMLGGLVWSFFIKTEVFYISLLAFALGILYSIPKIRFKDYSFSSMLTLGLGYGFVIPASSWFLFRGWDDSTIWMILLMTFSWFFAATNFKDFKDVPGDRVKGSKTMVILIGEQKTIDVMTFLMCVLPSSLLLIYVIMGFLPFWSIISLLTFAATFYVLRWLSGNYSPENAFKGYKATYFLYPSFFVLLSIGFWLGGMFV